MAQWCEKFGKVPVVIFAFNRPHLLGELLNRVKIYNPPHLLVVVDGPRVQSETDHRLVEQCLVLAESYEGTGEVVIDASPENLGLAERFSSGLALAARLFTKFIVLEDDCIPSQDFFRFSEELLHLYEDDFRVGMIQGGNLHPWGRAISNAYIFSDRPRVWGWATWATRVDGFDATRWTVSRVQAFKMLRRHRHGLMESVLKSKQIADALKIGTWDFQWVYRLWERNMLSACPSVNMIQNLGFGEDATHTKFESIIGAKPHGTMSFPLAHPEVVTVSKSFDRSEAISRKLHLLLFTIRNPLVVLDRYVKYFKILRKSRI